MLNTARSDRRTDLQGFHANLRTVVARAREVRVYVRANEAERVTRALVGREPGRVDVAGWLAASELLVEAVEECAALGTIEGRRQLLRIFPECED
jgi:Ser/Thr protein kinase RdoA (MazF antagonist)